MGLARRTRVAALVAFALFVALAQLATADAAMRWSAPVTIGEGQVNWKSLHMDARGGLLALWQRQGSAGQFSTFYAWRTAGGGWTTERQLGPNVPPGALFAAALAPHGQATVVWADEGKVVAADAVVGGDFSDARTIGQTDTCCGTTIDVALDDEGNALAAWSGKRVQQTEPGGVSGATIYAARRSPDGRWSAPELVRHGTTGAGPALAMNSAGAAVVAWTETRNADPHISYRPPGGSFAPAERVPSDHWGIPIVAMGEGGEAVVATASRSHNTADPWRALMAVRRPLGGWDEPVSFPTDNSPSDVSVAPDGSATMFMSDTSDRDHPQAQYVTRTPAGALHGPVTVAGDRLWGAIATNLGGDVIANLRTTTFADPLELAERPHGKLAFGPRDRGPGATGGAALALNDAGQAAMIWDTGSSPGRVRVAVRDDPALPVPPAPPTVGIASVDAPRLDGDGDLRIGVSCSTSCKAVPRGILATAGDTELVAGDGAARRVRAKRRAVLTIRFGSQQARAVRKAIRAGRKPWVSVSVRARGKSPRPITASRRIRLR